MPVIDKATQGAVGRGVLVHTDGARATAYLIAIPGTRVVAGGGPELSGIVRGRPAEALPIGQAQRDCRCYGCFLISQC